MWKANWLMKLLVLILILFFSFNLLTETSTVEVQLIDVLTNLEMKYTNRSILQSEQVYVLDNINPKQNKKTKKPCMKREKNEKKE